MPKLRAVDANHGMLTDHRIPRIPAPAGPEQSSSDLTSFLGTADDRALGIAYAQSGDPRARQYLLRASPADAQSGCVWRRSNRMRAALPRSTNRC